MNGSFAPEEKPTNEFMSDMLPVNKRQPLDNNDVAGPDTADGDDDDDANDDDIADSRNGITF